MAPGLPTAAGNPRARSVGTGEEIGRLRERGETAVNARTEAEVHRLAAERARRDEAGQADQFVNLLEDRIHQLEEHLKRDSRWGRRSDRRGRSVWGYVSPTDANRGEDGLHDIAFFLCPGMARRSPGNSW